MKKKSCACVFLLLVLCLLPACGADAGAEAYDAEALASRLEQAVTAGEAAVEVDYREEKSSLKAALPGDLARLLGQNYICSNLLENVTATYEETGGHTRVHLALQYKGETPYPIVPVASPEDILDALILRWNARRGVVTLLLEGFSCTEAEFFSLLDTAEINSALVPCEARGVYYEAYEPEGERQLVRMWVDLALPAEDVQEKAAALEEAVYIMAGEIDAGEPQDDSAAYRAVYDAVLQATRYDDTLAALTDMQRLSAANYASRTAYGALVEGRSICNGYARAYKTLCDALDLPCWVVSGSVKGVRHSWNLVRVEDALLYVDCTLADTQGEGEDGAPHFLFSGEERDAMGYEIEDYLYLPAQFAEIPAPGA